MRSKLKVGRHTLMTQLVRRQSRNLNTVSTVATVVSIRKSQFSEAISEGKLNFGWVVVVIGPEVERTQYS